MLQGHRKASPDTANNSCARSPARSGDRRFPLLALCSLSFALALSACGVPGEPLPPLLDLPTQVRDLAAAQQGNHMHLHWTSPTLTTEGTRPREFDRIEIYSAILPPGTAVTDFSVQSRLIATIPVSVAAALPSDYEVALTSSNIHQKAFFALKAVNRKGKSAGFSNIASASVADLPAPVPAIHATITETAVKLNWAPATASAFGGPPLQPTGYLVYRADAPSGQPMQVGESTTTSYSDSSFEFGRTYLYSIRAFSREGDSLAVTPDSAPLEVAPKDIFPPAAPRNLRAIAVPGAVELAWSPNSEPDLAGYNIYRKSGELFTRLNTALLRIPTYRDTAVTPGAPLIYIVKAVDKFGNEGPPSQEASVTAE